MAIQFTHKRLDGGSGHEHIAYLRWVNQETGETGSNAKRELVVWIEGGGKAFTLDSYGRRAEVGVVTPASGQKYLRTYADGHWTNNLLELPDF